MKAPAIFVRVGFDLPLSKTFLYSWEGPVPPVPGLRVRAPFSGRVLTGIVISVASEPGPDEPAADRIKPVASILDTAPLLSEEHFSLARRMADQYFCSVSEALLAMIPAGAMSESVRAGKEYPREKNPVPRAELTPVQAKAAADIDRELGTGKSASFLLYGVTGSGKSEIYFHLIRSCLARNRSAMLLVPEINLAVQVLFQIERYFPAETVSVLHSRLTANRKLSEWKAIASGRKRIVIGARSAVFAPLLNPGLFILDEEQSSSYKEHSRPRYHARQVAWMRSKANNAVLLLGSATPSLESYHFAKKRQFIPLFLPERHRKSPLPEVRIVAKADPKSDLTPELIEAVAQRLRKKEQVIMFHNRRGFADVMVCGTCGTTVRCPNCSISLTYHKNPPILLCHYCGHSVRDISPDCSACRMTGSMLPRGAGTQKLEVLLQKIFPSARIARFDADSTRKKNSAETVYFDFLNRKTDILVGTQMLSKGLHFPGVTLAGVVDFEDMASLPDYRSFENTFSMLLQVAGRTGRGEIPGEVIIQARNPEHPLIRLLLTHDFDAFYRTEIQNRQEAVYPPFCRLIRVLFKGPKEEDTVQASESAAKVIRSVADSFISVLGPVQAPLNRIQGLYRWHILIKVNRMTDVGRKIITAVQEAHYPGGVKCELDPDPSSLL
jgi:primosomal protein N' (replication factor Y)